MFETTLNKLESLQPLISIVNDEKITAKAKFLYDRICHPDSYLVFLGETSSGKSSLINGLLDEEILPVKASPSTASITEVCLSEVKQENEYYAINKNATIERLDIAMFKKLCEHPDKELSRLRVVKNTPKRVLKGLRIFDTPGYGSIIEGHEEVLKEFLPNSDIVVYTVLYRIGVQADDYSFLGFLKELIRDDVKIGLLINRCPKGVNKYSDPKIREIVQYVSDTLTIEPQYFCIDDVVQDANAGHPLPKCNELWDYVGNVLVSDERERILEQAFDGYVYDLYEECDAIIKAQYDEARMSEEEYDKIRKEERATAMRIRDAVKKLVIPAFEKIENRIPGEIDKAEARIESRMRQQIKDSKRTSKEEMVAYTNAHLLPFTIKQETDEVVRYLDVELTDLNNQVDDYIQKEIIHFNTQVSIILSSNADVAGKHIVEKLIKKFAENGLDSYFVCFGGNGGANAGIANAASHMLKKIGDPFGKTFSRETHNALKHTLSKIGATSMKAVGSVVAVVTEALFLGWEYSTWKIFLRKKVNEGIAKWKKETQPSVLRDIRKLEDKNIETIYHIAKEFDTAGNEERNKDIGQCKANMELSESIGKIFNK